MVGALIGGFAGAGLLLIGLRLLAMRGLDLGVRVMPYLRDLPRPGWAGRLPARTGAAREIFGPALRSAALHLERILGGGPSVRRRLERAGLDRTVQDFRVQQVVWGLVGFAALAAYGLLDSWRSGGASDVLASLVLCGLAFAGGVVLADHRLTARVRDREQALLLEFPAVAELLALAVAAGEGPVAALDRVVARSHGALSDELARVLSEVRTGTPVSQAFDTLAARTGVPLVARFAEGIAVAVERGTPLADVLHAQAADVREAGRRELIEAGARKEVLMMVPVVFLVLPVTIVFAFWPGVVGLSLVSP